MTDTLPHSVAPRGQDGQEKHVTPRLTKLEWQVVLDCLIFQECNDGDGRPWGSSNDVELTERQREKRDAAMESAIEKIRNAK